MNRLMLAFLLGATVFAWVHSIAIAGSLYWYYWWFDIVMHFWGGILLGVGVHAMTQLKCVPLRPSFGVFILTLSAAVISWEVFEWVVGLYDVETYLIDTAKDVLVGSSGGLLGYFATKMFTMKQL